MRNEITRKQLRSFGFTVGGIFALIGFWPVIVRSDDPRWWAMAVAGCLLVPALVLPRSLFWIYRGWMALGHVLGFINTRIILGMIFYAVVTPIGIVRRLLGKDPMGRRLGTHLDTYRIVRKPRPPSHLTKQY
jgi:Saxitoxin biosynthesis operon protein SxtJ